MSIFFKGELSWILVPIFAYLYIYFPKSRSIIFYPCLLISILGLYNTILLKHLILQKKYGLIQFILTIIFHLPFLLVIFQFRKYSYPNIYSLCLILLGMLILKFLPYWPYLGLTRNFMIFLLFILYLFLNLIFFFLRNL